MNKVIISVAILTVLGFTSCKDKIGGKAELTKIELSKNMEMTDLSFGVRGNCAMCKNTIEKATNEIDGVTSVNWDVDKKKIDVSFDGTKTNAMVIHNAIAASGYDTEKVVGSKDAYNELPSCCKYNHDMPMNQ